MIVMLKMNPTEYGCNLLGFPTAPQLVKSRSDVVCLVSMINCSVQPPESSNRWILIGNSSWERLSAKVCLQ
jgi:hypothetical protein